MSYPSKYQPKKNKTRNSGAILISHTSKKETQSCLVPYKKTMMALLINHIQRHTWFDRRIVTSFVEKQRIKIQSSTTTATSKCYYGVQPFSHFSKAVIKWNRWIIIVVHVSCDYSYTYSHPNRSRCFKILSYVFCLPPTMCLLFLSGHGCLDCSEHDVLVLFD